ncbi:MAG: response regulator [Anaerolineales bacterium]|nr:response regulator [Anaerolineales bacterium]
MHDLQAYHYLYVEDDPLSREVMQMIMGTAMGIETLTIFDDSSNFMERLQGLMVPHVILLDIHMKPHNGFEVLDMIRQDSRYNSTTIIALTASVMNEEVTQLRERGFNGAIAKPLSIQAFPTLLRQILEGQAVWHIAD